MITGSNNYYCKTVVGLFDESLFEKLGSRFENFYQR